MSRKCAPAAIGGADDRFAESDEGAGGVDDDARAGAERAERLGAGGVGDAGLEPAVGAGEVGEARRVAAAEDDVADAELHQGRDDEPAGEPGRTEDDDAHAAPQDPNAHERSSPRAGDRGAFVEKPTVRTAGGANAEPASGAARRDAGTTPVIALPVVDGVSARDRAGSAIGARRASRSGMDGILVLLALVAGLWFLVAPGIALASALGAATRQRELERQLADLEARLAGTVFRLEHSARGAPMHPPQPPHQLALAFEPPNDAVAAAAAERRGRAIAELAAAAAGERAAKLAEATRAEAVRVASVPPPAEVASAPKPADEAPAARPDGDEQRPTSLEEQLGVTWLTRAGAAAFLLGALFFFKHAVEKDWIGPGGRVALGAAVGIGLLGAAEIIRKTARDRFVHALAGIGLAVLFVTVWASSAFYTLAPRPVAFVLTGALAVFGAGLALRHKGQSIVILALVAAFLNPVLLATHGDHGLELFLYLFVVTQVSEMVAMKLRFKAVSQLSILGVTALFAGWYAKHRRRRRPRETSRSRSPCSRCSARRGAGPPRVSRVIPSGASRARSAPPRRSRWSSSARPIVLWDSPTALVVASIVIATMSAIAGRRVGAAQLLAPLFVGATGFAPGDRVRPRRRPASPRCRSWRSGRSCSSPPRSISRRSDRSPANAPRSLRCRSRRSPCSRPSSTRGRSPAINALTLAAVALVAGWLAARATRPAIALAFAVATGALVVATAAFFGGDAPAALLVASGVWALAAASPALRAAAVDARDAVHVGWEAPFAAAIGAVGFAAIAYFTTRPEAEALRAALLGGDAIVTLALALHASERRDDSDAAALFGGLALALGSAAIAFACEGATITVLWAVLAALAAVVARRSDRTAWQAIAAILFAAAIGRALFVDVAETLAATDRFMASRGADGVLSPAPFVNARALALASCAIALLVAARATWGMREGAPSRVAAIGGYGILLATLAIEVRDATRSLPALPAQPVGDAAWTDFLVRYDAATSSGHDARTMFTTLVLAVFAAALLSIGFGARSAFHRWLGLALFLVTVAKLALWDVWHVGSVEQVVLLTGVGALLVAGGFLYARFGKRLVAMIQGPRDEQHA